MDALLQAWLAYHSNRNALLQAGVWLQIQKNERLAKGNQTATETKVNPRAMTTTGERATSLKATARRSTPATYCEGCHEVAYLQLTVPSNFARVTRITVTVTSHDQGTHTRTQPCLTNMV